MSTSSTWFHGAPSDWQVVRTKFLFNREQRSVRDDDEVVTAFRDGQVTLRRNRRTEGFTNSEKEIGYQGIRSGDLVVHAMDAFAGAVGVSDSEGKATPVYSVCTPRRSDVFTPYYGRLLRHMALSGFIESLARGIRERSTEFRWGDLAEVALPVPPRREQERIANFLDEKTARIDALIAEKKKLAGLVGELRESTITWAVTGGLRGITSTLPVADSRATGCPANWKRGRVTNFIGPVVDYRGRTPEKVDEGVLLVTARNIRDGIIDYTASAEYTTAEGYEQTIKRGRPVIGDVLFTMEAPLGQVANVDREDIALAQRIVKFRGDPQILNNYYLKYWLMGDVVQSTLRTLATGSTAEGLKASKLGQVPLFVPPLPEQALIVKYLDDCLGRLDRVAGHVDKHASLLAEYRSSLISAAVTGQFDSAGLEGKR